jgi:hypothetical protein
MVDYSKWDKLEVSDDDDDVPPKSALPATTTAASKEHVRSSLLVFVFWNGMALNLLLMMPAQFAHESVPPPASAALAQHFSSEPNPSPSSSVIQRFHPLAASKKGPKRRQFFYKDQLVWVKRSAASIVLRKTSSRYEWEQSLDEVLVYIKTPMGVRDKHPTGFFFFGATS